MNTLALQQQTLVHSLLALPGSAGRQQADARLTGWLRAGHPRGLMAYRAHGNALAERALASVYPVVAQLIGPAAMASVSRALWHAHPPEEGDIGLWGAALSEWIDHCEDLRTVPYLSDVARAEWALHQAADAPDAEPDLASLALLQGDDPTAVCLRLAPGCALLGSPWPVADLIHHHRSGQPPLQQLQAALQNPRPRHAWVVREGWRCVLLAPGATEARLLAGLLAGQPLGPALDHALAVPLAEGEAPFDFPVWLMQQVQAGHITGAFR